MDLIATRQLRSLTEEAASPCLSIYLPTHVSGENGQQDVVRLKNLLDQAEQALVDGWMSRSQTRKMLQPAYDLPNDTAFWMKRSHGLAMFLSPVSFSRFRLPRNFDELVLVNSRFHIKPLLPLLTDDDRFYILALSQNRVQLLQATGQSVEVVELAGLPTNMADTLNYVGADRGNQVHSAMHGSLGKQAAVFHGQGGQAETRKDDLAQFFRQVDAALAPLLRKETRPLLLGGVEYLLPIYRDVSSYTHIAGQELVGNCDYLTAQQIHDRAWPLMRPFFDQTRQDAIAKYRQLAGTGKATDDLRTIVPAADEGRIETLLVDVQAVQWGRFDTSTRWLEIHERQQPGDDDLLDLATTMSLSQGGSVYAIGRDQMPTAEPAAAIFRY